MARRTADDAAQTRRALLDSGSRLFGQSGFALTSLTAVAADAGVTRGAIHHHFGNKTDLFTAVFIALEEELDATVRAATTDQPTARDAFMAACAAWLDFAVRPAYRQIALTDAPAVLGAETWHRIDTAIGLTSMQLGLTALHADNRSPSNPHPSSPCCCSAPSPKPASHSATPTVPADNNCSAPSDRSSPGSRHDLALPAAQPLRSAAMTS
jgi:AcrR family transcriptional regulator